jgi:hypothetical protein
MATTTTVNVIKLTNTQHLSSLHFSHTTKDLINGAVLLLFHSQYFVECADNYDGRVPDYPISLPSRTPLNLMDLSLAETVGSERQVSIADPSLAVLKQTG